jgi:hypothetical protein
MLIASAQLEKDDDGKDQQLLILGLSAENRRRLGDGKPIDLSRASHGMAIPAGLRIMIFAGETEDSMREQLGALIDPARTVIDQRQPY